MIRLWTKPLLNLEWSPFAIGWVAFMCWRRGRAREFGFWFFFKIAIPPLSRGGAAENPETLLRPGGSRGWRRSGPRSRFPEEAEDPRDSQCGYQQHQQSDQGAVKEPGEGDRGRGDQKRHQK